jgi:hypothetical protein
MRKWVGKSKNQSRKTKRLLRPNLPTPNLQKLKLRNAKSRSSNSKRALKRKTTNLPHLPLKKELRSANLSLLSKKFRRN